MVRRLATVALAALLCMAPGLTPEASAQAVPVVGGILGTVGGTVATIATITYAIDNQSFHNGWIVLSMFTSAAALASAGMLFEYAEEPALLTIALINVAVAAVPGYWTIRTALSDVTPGDPFEPAAEVEPAPAVLEPLAVRRRTRLPRQSGLRLPLLVLRF